MAKKKRRKDQFKNGYIPKDVTIIQPSPITSISKAASENRNAEPIQKENNN